MLVNIFPEKIRLDPEKGRDIKISREVYNVIIENGCNIEYGARYLNRVIETLLLQPLTKYVLENLTDRDIFVSISNDVIRLFNQ